MANIPILMLGSDFQYAYATPLGYDLTSEDKPTGMQDKQGRAVYADNTGIQEFPHLFVLVQGDKVAVTLPLKAISGSDTAATVGKTLEQIFAGVKQVVTPDNIKSTAQVIAAIKGQNPGISDADAAKAAGYAQSRFSLGGSMPWIIMGAVGLVAVMMLMGTRRS